MVYKSIVGETELLAAGGAMPETDTTPRLVDVIPSDHPEVARRLSYYGDRTVAGFRKILHAVVFVSCGKAHEFNRKDCGMEHVNGRCAHQRPSNTPQTSNALTTVRDALLFAQARGKNTSVDVLTDPRNQQSPFYPIWRNLLALDSTAAHARACIELHADGKLPANAHPAIEDKRTFVASLKVLEEERASPLEVLHHEAKRLFDEVLEETACDRFPR